MGERMLATTLFLSAVLVTSSSAQSPSCANADDCRRLTREAIAAGQYERAHDLAWLAYQKASRDTGTLVLLARAQSLSGRGDDAFVMLRRLAEAGVAPDDIETGDDFDRVRRHSQWPQLQALIATLAEPAPIDEPAPAPTRPASSVSLPAPKPEAPANGAAAVSTPAPKVEALEVEPVLSGDDLALPEDAPVPTALAHDAVSARFVLGYSTTDALTVLSQTSTNATALTSPGWSGRERTTAIAIDAPAGDLWVAVHGASGAALHRLQLISGRRLDHLELPPSDNAEFIAVHASRKRIFALDRTGRRVYWRAPESSSLEVWTSLPADIVPTSLAVATNALFVGHAEGLLRIDLTSKRQRRIAAKDPDMLSDLHSMAWRDGVLVGVQRRGDRLIVLRVRVNAAGSAATRIENVGQALSRAATLSAGSFHYLSPGAAGVAVRAIKVN